MTSTSTLKTRMAAVISLAAALALVTGSTVALASPTTEQVSPMSAKRGAGQAPKALSTPKAIAAPPAVSAATIAADFSSIFADQLPDYANSGWSACPTPITWSIDTRGLTDDKAATEVSNMQWAFDTWAQASGLQFQYAGVTAFSYDDASFTLTPADGSTSPGRHIYLAMVADQDSARLGGGTVGLGSPGLVMSDTKEITGGAAVFRTDFVAQATPTVTKSLYLHELGHVLGLAHATQSANVMYPIVTDHVVLGGGDVAGVNTMTKPCAA